MRGDKVKSPAHRSDLELVVLMLAAFGPYVIAGVVRVDHLLIYPLFAVRLALLAVGGAALVLRLRPLGDLRLLLLLIFLLVAGVTILLRNYQAPRQLLGAAENYFQPIAVITIVGTAIAGRNDVDLRHLAIRLINLYLALLMLNAVVAGTALSLSLTGHGELALPLLRPFWGQGDAEGITVAERALGALRFSGIFDQPFEAGLQHSFGLLLGVFVIRLEERTPATRDYVRLLLIAAGGLLAFSKVIIFGGLPLLLAYLAWEKWLGRMLRSKLVIAVLLLGATAGGVLLSWWSGVLDRIWTSTNLIQVLIGPRFRAGGVVATVAAQVLESSPLVGLGFGPFTTYDNAYLEYWAQGGVFALMLYMLILTTLARAGVRQRWTPVGRFYAVSTLFVALAGIGAPILTANRFTVVFWMLITVLLTRDALRRRSRHTVTQPPLEKITEHG